MIDQTKVPVIKGVTYFLGHVPGLVRHGSKPSRELAKDPELEARFVAHLEGYEAAMAYPPNQVFIGNLSPDELASWPLPWYKNPVSDPKRTGPFGEIMPEDEFYAALKMCDEFNLIQLEQEFIRGVANRLESNSLFRSADMARIGQGVPMSSIQSKLKAGYSLPLYVHGNQLVGACSGAMEEDAALSPDILLENLCGRASGVMALRALMAKTGTPDDVEYILGCGEEAVGDRYNRGGGNMAKAIGELSGCRRATGSDIKAFCCAPVHAISIGAALVASSLYRNVVVCAGGSLAKLGMKFQGHLKHGMPVLEDTLAGIAIRIGENDSTSPVIRLDSIGKHEIGSGSSQQAILEKLVIEPLDRLGLSLTDVDKFATELHNPELTEPQGSGNVPRTNYRIIGSFAVLRHEIEKQALDAFLRIHGMPGFSPTQGHIASAVPFLGHSIEAMKQGRIKNTMFLAKGSLFLGRMTQLSDGISLLLEKNPATMAED